MNKKGSRRLSRLSCLLSERERCRSNMLLPHRRISVPDNLLRRGRVSHKGRSRSPPLHGKPLRQFKCTRPTEKLIGRCTTEMNGKNSHRSGIIRAAVFPGAWMGPEFHIRLPGRRRSRERNDRWPRYRRPSASISDNRK
jgi:hypothetical protein